MKKSGETQETSCRNYCAPGSMRGKRETLGTWLLPVIIDFPVNHFQTRFTFVNWRNTVSKAIKSIHGVQPPGLPWVLCSDYTRLFITSSMLGVQRFYTPFSKKVAFHEHACLAFHVLRTTNIHYVQRFLTYASKHCLAHFAVTRNTTKTEIHCVYRVRPRVFRTKNIHHVKHVKLSHF